MYKIVEPHELRQSWGFVRKGLEHILRKSPEWWIPEDVYAALSGNKANLWLWSEDDKVVGFIVGYMHGDTFIIWCAYGRLTDIQQAFGDIEAMVKGQCSRITFESWRPGWSRVAKKLGFNPRGWVKEL
jgi:hypothetical protein